MTMVEDPATNLYVFHGCDVDLDEILPSCDPVGGIGKEYVMTLRVSAGLLA